MDWVGFATTEWFLGMSNEWEPRLYFEVEALSQLKFSNGYAYWLEMHCGNIFMALGGPKEKRNK